MCTPPLMAQAPAAATVAVARCVLATVSSSTFSALACGGLPVASVVRSSPGFMMLPLGHSSSERVRYIFAATAVAKAMAACFWLGSLGA